MEEIWQDNFNEYDKNTNFKIGGKFAIYRMDKELINLIYQELLKLKEQTLNMRYHEILEEWSCTEHTHFRLIYFNLGR